MPKPVFEEKQALGRGWLLFVVGATSLVGWWALLSSVVHVLPVPHGRGINWPHSTLGGLLTWVGMAVAVPALFLFARMTVRVTRSAVEISYFPLARKRTIALGDIESAHAREYHPFKEFGGQGIKGTRKNRLYSTSGTHGVQIVLKDGSKVLAGSGQANKLERAINDQLTQHA